MLRSLRRILSLDDFEAAARRRLPRAVFAYVCGAVETNAAWRDNRSAFDEWGFVARTLVDVSKRSTAATLFGQAYAQPFGIAPMGIAALSAYRGDLVLARAAARANIPMVMSGSSLIRLEEVARENPAAWFQAYLPGDDRRIAPLVERVAGAGFGTLVVTVDVAVLSNRENNIRAGFSTPLRPSARLAWDGLTHPRWLFGDGAAHARGARHAALRELLRRARRRRSSRAMSSATSRSATTSTGGTSSASARSGKAGWW